MRPILRLDPRHGAILGLCLLAACALPARASPVSAITPRMSSQTAGAQPLVIGETFQLDSRQLGESRRINVYLPAAYRDDATTPLPVLYMPDG